MICGNPAVIAIESGITEAYERLSFLALGFFVLHVGGCRYGVHLPNASMLGCSFGEVEKRISERGTHTADYAEKFDAGAIADAFRTERYGDLQQEAYLGIAAAAFCETFDRDEGGIVWAPDGDEAFDDGSYVLHFDVAHRVRLIAFRTTNDGLHDPETIRDVWVDANEFYNTLRQWRDDFLAEWVNSPKVMDTDGRREV